MRSDPDDRSSQEGTKPASDPSRIPSRFVEIDTIKAIGIVVVVLIHSIRAPWDPRSSSIELWLGIVTRFAVPGFVFCSGFLYATQDRIPTRDVWRRLRRVLVPYLICSIAAQLFWIAVGQGHPVGEMFREILFGASFGPFYYVFVHFGLVLVAPALVLLSTAQIAWLTVITLIVQASLESSLTLALPLFWHVRNPLLWWGYFLLGWLVRLHYPTVSRWVAERRALLIGLLVLAIVPCTALAQAEDRTVWVRGAMWLDIHLFVALIFVSTCARRNAPRAIAALSDATFAIYLLHLFFVYSAERFVQPAVNSFDLSVIGLYWGVGLFGALAVIVLARALLGKRSRDVIGA